ncbi:GNAT family N-acetyltransferase [Haloplasma contractile]|uniref:Phospholipiddiacylglycerol acyltransferase protein n=1 Tax=Haloplasma contractile SSD-17B TaxID=1033810 RepID=U2DYC6_9MOLU|nr:GNAT family N-acetyltransferase [Haloplasma contractile]ERJ13262.1 phospholipiddiacylglycerol acyltransferase protein [Haloplasma contractile SSD-17B]
MIYLKKLNIEDAQKEYKFFQDTPPENGFTNEYYNISFDEFINSSIPTRINYSAGVGLKIGRVPDTYYFLWDDKEIVGIFKVRHYLNDFLRNGPGHIGFAIHPNHRGKRYAYIGLSLAIEEFKNIRCPEEDEIYLSCHLDNKASLKVQLKSGAYIHHSDEKEYYTRIKIK